LLVEPCPELKALCQEFASIFGEAKGLPPQRTHDPQIPLVFGADMSTSAIYTPWEQKNIIEKMISEMLEAGIIRDSRSAYASPIVLVKKADGA